MELDTKQGVIDEPKPDDVLRAVAEAASDPECSITLSDDNGYVEAARRDDGSFDLARHDGTRRHEAAEPVDAEALTAILLAFLKGDTRWRKRVAWVPAPAPSKAAAASGEPPAWAIGAVLGSLGLIAVASNLPRDWLPFLDTTLGTIALFSLPFLALIGAAIANVAIKMKRAQSWLETEARITRSQLKVRRPPPGNEIGTAVNVPDITYVFTVRGQSFRGQRVNLGDISGAFAEEAVRRYPVGARVTVYYDPRDPTDCVLERGLAAAPASLELGSGAARETEAAGVPKAGVAGPGTVGCVSATLLLAALAAGGYWLAHGGVATIEAAMPRANVPVMLFALGFGALVLLFFIGYRRHLMRANRWPVVKGQVTVSRVEERRSGSGSRVNRSHEAIVEYRYSVGGLSYSSRQIALGLRSSGSRKGAEKVLARYPLGAAVEVHYDPANPSEAALENPTYESWLLFVVALGCFGIALYASHLLR